MLSHSDKVNSGDSVRALHSSTPWYLSQIFNPKIRSWSCSILQYSYCFVNLRVFAFQISRGRDQEEVWIKVLEAGSICKGFSRLWPVILSFSLHHVLVLKGLSPEKGSYWRVELWTSHLQVFNCSSLSSDYQLSNCFCPSALELQTNNEVLPSILLTYIDIPLILM